MSVFFSISLLRGFLFHLNLAFSLAQRGNIRCSYVPASVISVPKYNVATSNFSASVIEGVSRTRNSLLDGNTQFYDWESGYTCHQLGSGCILIQLGQPYLIDSMRLVISSCSFFFSNINLIHNAN